MHVQVSIRQALLLLRWVKKMSKHNDIFHLPLVSWIEIVGMLSSF